MLSKQRKIQHLYWRAGYGIKLATLNVQLPKDINEIVDEIISDSKRYRPLEIVEVKDYIRHTSRKPTAEEKSAFKKDKLVTPPIAADI